MKAVTKAVTATASTSSVVGGGYTIYHFSSAEGVSPEEEQDSSFSELKSDEVSSKVLKDEANSSSNETVEESSKKKSELQTVSNPKNQQVNKKQDASVKKPTEDELYKEAIQGLTTFSSNDLSNNAYKDKFIGITKENNLPKLVKDDSNEKWWNWSFKNKHETSKQKTNLHNLFSSIKKGYSSTDGDQTALNQACKLAYNKPKSDYSFEITDFLLQNISSFCTVGKKEYDISEPRVFSLKENSSFSSNYQEGILGVGENKNFLVDPWQRNENYNDLWWKWAYLKRFKGKTNLTDAFKEIKLGFDPNLNTGLNGACHKIFGTRLETLRKKENKLQLFNEISQFCSINPKQRLIIVRDSQPHPQTFNLTVANSLDRKYTNKILDLIDLTKLNKYVKTDVENNEDWWEWTFEKVYLKNKPNERIERTFNDVNEGYSKTNKKALNQVCESLYAEDQSEYSFFYWGTNLKNLAKFCTISEDHLQVLKPKELTFSSENPYFGPYNTSAGLLSKSANFSNLISPSKFQNNKQEVKYLWEWVWETRFPKSENERNNLTSVFKPVTVGSGGSSDKDALNQVCASTYKLNLSEFKGTTTKEKLLKEVQRFCTVDPSRELTV